MKFHEMDPIFHSQELLLKGALEIAHGVKIQEVCWDGLSTPATIEVWNPLVQLDTVWRPHCDVTGMMGIVGVTMVTMVTMDYGDYPKMAELQLSELL